jgi:hypothetical protein
MYYSQSRVCVTWWKVSLTQSGCSFAWKKKKKGFGKLFNNSNIYFLFQKEIFYFLGNSIAAAHFLLDTQKKTHRVTICNESK